MQWANITPYQINELTEENKTLKWANQEFIFIIYSSSARVSQWTHNQNLNWVIKRFSQSNAFSPKIVRLHKLLQAILYILFSVYVTEAFIDYRTINPLRGLFNWTVSRNLLSCTATATILRLKLYVAISLLSTSLCQGFSHLNTSDDLSTIKLYWVNQSVE